MKKQSVLLVDDLPTNLLLLERSLKRLDLNIVKAASGPEALELIARQDFAVILLDVQMPEMDGFEVARRVREGAASSVPIIFVTAMNPEQQWVFEGYEAGAVDFLFKPIDPKILLGKVRVFCELHKQEAVIREQVEQLKRQKEQLVQEMDERQRAQEAVRQSEVRYRALMQLSPEAVIVQSGGKLVYANTSLLRLLGASEPEQVGHCSLDHFVHPDDREAIAQLLSDTEKRGGRADPIEVRLMRLDGCCVHVEAHTACVLYEGTTGVQVALRDITDRKRIESDLRRLSEVDGLTGLANRRTFDGGLENEWYRARRDRVPLSLVMIDIDFFKSFNDNYGHQAGDECLRLVAVSLQEAMRRPGDLVARYGGEEFVAILPNTSCEGAAALAETLRQRIESLRIQHRHSPVAHWITISAGVATLVPDSGVSPDRLVAATDRALYQAKGAGRNRVCAAAVPPPTETAESASP